MTTLANTLQALSNNPEYVNLRQMEGVRIDLKYGTTDNFMGKDVYAEFTEPFLHRVAAEKLSRAVSLLRNSHPGWNLLVFDALRPRSIQRQLWSYVVGTPQEVYVADPDQGSMHNYGCAIDLSVCNEKGIELDMGTAFDTFDPLSQPKLEQEHLTQGKLTSAQIANRLVLRHAMTSAGFLQLSHEWWHYDAFAASEVRAQFKMIE